MALYNRPDGRGWFWFLILISDQWCHDQLEVTPMEVVYQSAGRTYSATMPHFAESSTQLSRTLIGINPPLIVSFHFGNYKDNGQSAPKPTIVSQSSNAVNKGVQVARWHCLCINKALWQICTCPGSVQRNGPPSLLLILDPSWLLCVCTENQRKTAFLFSGLLTFFCPCMCCDTGSLI
jgi:hypothetical protein